MASDVDQIWVDDGVAADDVAWLYRTGARATGKPRFADLTDDDIAQFSLQGFLVVEQAFTEEDVAAALASIQRLAEGRHADFTGIQFERAARDRLATIAPAERIDAVRKLAAFVDFEPALKALAVHPGLTGTLERIMGERPVMFQDQALLKPPFIGREKPWHQDNAFFSLPAEAAVVGAWIALDPADVDNGCMHILPGTHVAGPVPHFKRRDWQICDTSIPVNDVVAVPLAPGGCLLFHGLLHHGTPPSHSARRRRAVQLHYHPASVSRTSEDERLAVWGSEGKGVTC